MTKSILAFLLCVLPVFGQTQLDYKQIKNGPGVSVTAYGALCNGVADDRIAIQAAIDAVGSGTLIFPLHSCAVSSPGIYLYPANGGITLSGTASIPAGSYSPTTNPGGGLVAYAASPPTVLLTVFAQNAKLNNIYLDCNNAAATNGIVSVMGLYSIWNYVTARNCAGDGAVIDNYTTPTTAVTAGGTVGSTAFTVTSLTNNRLTFGTYYCSQVVFDVGTANQEQLAVSSASSGVIHTFSPAAFTHTSARCAGNTNSMTFTDYTSYTNGGWGFRIGRGTDIGAQTFINGHSTGNASGGEKWIGGAHKHFGGDYQGDNGPAVQLGDTSGGTSHLMNIGPLGDVEENLSANNTILSVCDDRSNVWFTLPAYLTITNAGTTCAAYIPNNGPTTTGNGPDGNGAMVTKTFRGLFRYGLATAFDLTNAFTTRTVPNFIATETGVNGAIAGALLDQNGVEVPIAAGLRITIQLSHTLTGGGVNTFKLNSDSARTIISHRNSGNLIATGYAANALIDLEYYLGNWMDVSQ